MAIVEEWKAPEASQRCLGGATEAVEAVEAPAEMVGGGVAETVEATSSDTITAPPGASSASAHAFRVAPGTPLPLVRAFVLLPLVMLYSPHRHPRPARPFRRVVPDHTARG
ncbi:hypothetical protein B0H14DRAFT_3869430 [Mycena olivaceomarginata]|nr:hypothetical protein B0H14DRAFT_3869430 [Mycena olivaceomarginata]